MFPSTRYQSPDAHMKKKVILSKLCDLIAYPANRLGKCKPYSSLFPVICLFKVSRFSSSEERRN